MFYFCTRPFQDLLSEKVPVAQKPLHDRYPNNLTEVKLLSNYTLCLYELAFLRVLKEIKRHFSQVHKRLFHYSVFPYVYIKTQRITSGITRSLIVKTESNRLSVNELIGVV